MNGKERIRAVFQGGPVDKAPVMHISFSSRVASDILGREAYVGGGIQQWREAAALWNGGGAHGEFLERSRADAVDIAVACGHDMVRTTYWRRPVKPAGRIDEHTFRYDAPDGTWEMMRLDPKTEMYNRIDGSVRGKTALEDLDAAVEAEERSAEDYTPSAEDFADLKYASRRVGTELAIRAAGPWLSIPIDTPVWLEAAILRPDLVGRLLDAQVKRAVKEIPVVTRSGGEFLFGGGDFASNQGPVYSPRVFHDLILPRLQVLCEACRRLGAYFLFGTDGNVWPVSKDLYGASGIDGHFEFDRRAGMNPLEVHAKHPNLVMFGNIASFTLHTGSVEDVRRETRECLEEAKATGKVVTGCSNIIVPETPMANVITMLETIDTCR